LKPVTVADKKEEKKAAAPVADAKPAMVVASDVLASPMALQLLQEYGIDASQVKGTGSNGKITKLDALEAIVKIGGVKQSGSKSSGRNARREKMSNLRKTVSKRLVASKNETAMLTTFNEVNMKPVMDLRAKYKKRFEEQFGVGLGFMSFFTRAVCIALQDWPAVNASIEGEEIIYHDYCDISIAVSAPKGLVVPVIRSAENMSLDEIEKEVKRLAGKARENKLTIDEMTGGTFTITNGGVFGSMMSTPIINQPQSGILGMHNIIERPIAENGQVVIRPMMYLALSYDHRIIDGRESVSFLVRVKTLLENPEMMLDGKNPQEKVLGL
jgi:2-oxoglutarate dehydrogenase E2 component (dihydrolipoamide succinyltransferase)